MNASLFSQVLFSSLMFFVPGHFFLYGESGAKVSKTLPEDEVVIPDTLVDKSGLNVSSEIVEQKYVGLYFSASWCGPCRKFTPKLIEFRNKHADDFEVILVGADGSPKAQSNYMKKYSMPWLAMKNQSVEAKHASKVSGVEVIPYLVILDNKGNIITKNGKKDLSNLGDGALEYWKDL